jgi:hypothetical protein
MRRREIPSQLPLGPHRGHTGTNASQRIQRSCGPNAARDIPGNDWRPRNPGPPLVGDTGIEPVTPTVSTFSRDSWLRWLTPGPAGYGPSACWSGWLRWLLSDVVLHDRCTSPPEKIGSAAADLMTRFKPQAVPPEVTAFHRAGVSLGEQRAGSIRHSPPGSRWALQSAKNARTAAAFTSPRSRSRSTLL